MTLPSLGLADGGYFSGTAGFPVQIIVDFKAGEANPLEFGKRDITPLGIEKIVVQNGKAEENILSVKFGDVPV